MTAVLGWGCGDDDAGPGHDAGAPDDGSAGRDASPDLDSGVEACALIDAAHVEGDAIPGRTVPLDADGAGGRTDFEALWSVPVGTLSAETGLSVEWTIPQDAALHTAVTLTVTVTATAPGCEPQDVTLDVVVDFPPGLRTVVLYNPRATRSDEVAARYAALRAVPDEHLCSVAAADIVTLPGTDFPAFSDAVLACIDAAGPQVHAIVPVWGVPYKVSGRIRDLANGNFVTTSLDALLFFGPDAEDQEGPGGQNPAYQYGDSMDADYDPVVPWGELREQVAFHDRYLVARMDGADADAAIALVDRTQDAITRAAAGTLAGIVYVDGNRGLPHPAVDTFGSYEGGEWNIIGVENVFAGLGWYDVVADYDNAEFGTDPAPLSCPDALYYAGWYSFGHYNDAFTWAPGAIGGHLDSCSACDIRGERDWSAMALRRGITATFGAVNEPYVAGMPEYDQFFLYLTQGASYGEAAYESTIIGPWMMVWIGDPWYRPY